MKTLPCLLSFVVLLTGHALAAEPASSFPEPVEAALNRAGENRVELVKALSAAPIAQKPGIEFLVAHMPEIDLRGLRADYLLENTGLAYEAFHEAPWASQVPSAIFLNDVLPYASLNERRDQWRGPLRTIAAPLVKACQTPGEAAQVLNRELFGLLKVRYSTERKKPDQSALETMASGVATCSGLSILLVDACRAVGVPARIAGTPMWSNLRGNHTWVEVWEGGDWHFLGAAEPDAKGLDHGWFNADAARAQRDVPAHAIYASSFAQTGLSFPLVWNPRLDWVPAVNVTDRYTGQAGAAVSDPKLSQVKLLVRVITRPSGRRVAAQVTLRDPAEASFALEGESRGETADLNHFLGFNVARGRPYQLRVAYHDQVVLRDVQTIAGTDPEQIVTIALTE